MYIEELSLVHFRNLHRADIKMNQGINIFYGNNAQGKTNLLEAVYLCATGRSQRTRIDSQMILFGQKESHIQLIVIKDNVNKNKEKIDVHLKREGKKGIAVNTIPIRKLGELFGTLPIVIFSPEDLNLIKEGPAERRRFLDMELCQLNKIYYYDLQQYYKILKQRNAVLKNMQKNKKIADTLSVWDSQLVQYGKKIISARKKFVENLNEIAGKKHKAITAEKENLKIEYKPNTSEKTFEERLNHYRNRDFIMGTTVIGPHKDDLLFLVNEKDVKVYGSQGQQRTAALSAKLAEIDLIIQETGYTPVLLLDDVLSELDEMRQNYLLKSIDSMQAILTCTGIEDAVKKYIEQSYVYHVENGQVKKISTVKEYNKDL